MNSVMQLKKIYEMLEDEQSRNIFLWRLNYHVTGNQYFIKRIVDTYLPDFYPWVHSQVSDLIDRIPGEMILWGAGNLASENLWMFQKKKARIFAFCDKNRDKQQNGFYGYKVIDPSELRDHTDKSVILATWHDGDEMRKVLHEFGFSDDRILEMPRRHETCDQYFDSQLIEFCDNETFIDAGCFNMGTTIDFLRSCPGESKVYAFEPDVKSYEICKSVMEKQKLSNVELYNYGTWSEKTTLSFYASGDLNARITTDGSATIETCRIDDVVKPVDRVTYIKMDIEGAELEALKGAQNTIRKDKPRLAISIYHKAEDLIEIPAYIKELCPEYKLYIRHYSNDFTETVLYAIP